MGQAERTEVRWRGKDNGKKQSCVCDMKQSDYVESTIHFALMERIQLR